jgi:hypothetical protein
VRSLVEAIKRLEQTYGLKINMEKSEILSVGGVKIHELGVIKCTD